MRDAPKQVLHLLKDAAQAAKVGYTLLVEPHLKHGIDYAAGAYEVAPHSALHPFHTAQMSLRATDIIDETVTTKTFRLERTDGPLPLFQAGQYVNLFVEIDGVQTSRPFSPSSRPGSDFLDVTVKQTPGGFVSTHLLERVRVGDCFESTGPDGHFHEDDITDREELVLLAGGSGITPFMSMIRDHVHRGFSKRVHLLYGCRDPEDVIFGRELAQVAEAYAYAEWFQYTLVISEPPAGYSGVTGLLNAELIRRQVGAPGESGTPADRSYYVCGSRLMADYTRRELLALGVPRHRIKLDLSGPPHDVTQELGWPEGLTADSEVDLVVKGRGRYRVRAGEPLMSSLERYGIVTPARCRSGACGVCRARVLAGRVFMPPDTAVRESDLDHGYIHTCVAYPLTDLELQIPL